MIITKQLDEEERAGCFAFVVVWMYSNCKCPAVLPQSAVGWSVVCDCRIIPTYFLVILSSLKTK